MLSAPFNELDNFVKGWFIDPKICDKVVNYFEKNSAHHTKGVVGQGVDESIKTSTDLSIHPNQEIFTDLSFYFDELSKAVNEYKKIFTHLDKINQWQITEGGNIQKYKPNEAYFATHCETQTLNSSHRVLVWTTYLNDVNDGGETYFPNENLKIKAQKGLTVFFPPSWTHPHCGIVSPTETKYIITGWYSFVC
jgi:hypothetical protein